MVRFSWPPTGPFRVKGFGRDRTLIARRQGGIGTPSPPHGEDASPHPAVMVDNMTNDDDLSPDELEQLARSLSMDGSLGRNDAQRVGSALRRLARLDADGGRSA